MALPTFFIIGAAKAGTTSLHHYLDQHPQIQMSANKEPNFFAGPEDGIPYNLPRVSSLDRYESLFDPSVDVRGEASPGYSNHPRRKGVPERIKQLVPQARFIYLVRDPVARTISHYQDSVAIGTQRGSLRDALGDLSDPYLPLTCHSRYASQLELYLRHFPAERVLVVDHADLLAERRATLREIFSFLEVEESFDSPCFDAQLYASHQRSVYRVGLGYWRFVERFVAPPMRRVPPRLRRATRRSLERALLPTLEAPEVDAELRSTLEEHYAEEMARLRALTGKSFPTWSV